MKTSDFWYDLPKELIAQTPCERRDGSRMLALDRESGEVTQIYVWKSSPVLSGRATAFVFNDSRVIPARLRRRGENGGHAELLSFRQIEGAAG